MIEEIKALYEKLPSSVCTDGCFTCCKDIIQFSKSEEAEMGGYENCGLCCHVKDAKCSVHEKRPFICRLFGVSELLPCEGCTPERYLSAEETEELLREYLAIRKREASELP